MGLWVLWMLAIVGVLSQRWPPEKAREWYAKQKWIVGCNFAPSTAINELEMWQPETFDMSTIDRELQYAQGIGFNSLRIFLHYFLWRDDPKGLRDRMNKFLTLTSRHGITVMFVLLDDCWQKFPKSGKQPEPRPHVHNSGWVQSPGELIVRDLERQKELEGYVKDVLTWFANDTRVLVWDLYNEPGNGNPEMYSLPMLQKVFTWARTVNPSQPIISAVWSGSWHDPEKLSGLNKFMLFNSDIVVFHNYGDPNSFKNCYNDLLQYGRPIICNEYMARTAGSTFQGVLPFMKEKKVGAYNWGFVSGKTQTIYPWDSWYKNYTEEPKVWFHDIFRPDGSPFDPAEVALIKSLTH